MSGLAEPVRTRLLPALLTAVGVTLLAAGLLSFTTPVTADPGPSAIADASDPDASTTPTLISLPPLGSSRPSASASFPADRVVTRVRVAALKIDLPVVAPGDGTEYPLCNVAQYFSDPRLGQPGEGRATYLYGHAREGMFLPLLDASQVKNGKAMLGMIVEVWTSDDQRFLYEITEVRRHAPVLTAFDDPDHPEIEYPFTAKTDEVWLQTSEGPAVPKGQTPNPKLQVVAQLLSQQASAHGAAHPKPHPVVCG